MSFGSRLKERREQLGITQIQLAEKLGVSKGAIGNYETDLNSPKATILYKVFEVLNCDANYLFQDEMNESPGDNDARYEAYKWLIDKYISLDGYGRKAVDAILEIECERCSAFVKRGDFYAAEELKEVARANEKDFNPNTSDGDSFRRAMYRIKDKKKGE